ASTATSSGHSILGPSVMP
nr:45K protein - pig roundworm [Ascaris suum]